MSIGDHNLEEQPWLDLRLTKQTMDHLWNCIINGKQKDAREKLAGNISKSEFIEDTDNLFYDNVLKNLTEYLYYKDWNNYYNVHVREAVPAPVFVLQDLWVNYMKQHEFNPPHNHSGGIGFSFVVFMKIPTHWKEQHALPINVNSGAPVASDFQFFLNVANKVGIEYKDKVTFHEGVKTIQFSLSSEDEGRMLFFPAWLVHQVFPFYECEEERITISGNIFLTGENYE